MQMKISRVVAALALSVLIPASALAQQVKTRINFPLPAAGISANPVTNLVYVVAPSFGGPNDSLVVIDGNTDKIVNTVAVPTGAYLPAVDYVTNRIYVAGCNSFADPVECFVTVVDGNKNKVTATIPITSTPGSGILGIAVNPISYRVYVANASDNVIDVISAYSNKIVGTIAVGDQTPAGLAVNPFDSRLYVPFGNNQLGVIDTAKGKLISTTTAGSALNVAAVDLVTGNVFVTDSVFGPSTTVILDVNGNVLATVPVGDTPYGVDVNSLTNRALVASTALKTVTVINGSTYKAIKTIANVSANFVAVNLATGKTYLAGNNGVVVLTAK